MHAWEAIQTSLNHIEDCVGENIEIEELARIAALSPFYYQRLFARLVKKPVREYIKLRRLVRASTALCDDASSDKQNRIIDVAVEYGFSSRETFTRAFKDAYGISPAQYQDDPVGLENFDKPDLLLNYVMVDEGVPLISEGIVLEYNRKMLDEPLYFLGIQEHVRFRHGKMYGEKTGLNGPAEVWDRFFKIRKDIPGKTGRCNIGVHYKGDAPEGYSTYFAGAEVAPDRPSAPGTEDSKFVGWQLPVREYVVCAYEAENEEQLFASLGSMMKFTRFWLKSHGLRAEGFFPEMYFQTAKGLAYMEMWVPFKERENNE